MRRVTLEIYLPLGAKRPVQLKGGSVHMLPAWVVWFGPSLNAIRRTDKGPRPLYELAVIWGLKAEVDEGEHVHRGEWRVAFDWPFRLLKLWNTHYSRAWTGREFEIIGIEWGWGLGRRRHILRRPL